MSSIADINNTMTQVQNSTNAAYAKNKKVGTTELGQDAFLRLMIEQMKNQDPTKPTDSSQMMLQNAQFTQISELQKLNKSMTSMSSVSQACSLMGKAVTILDPNDKTGQSTLTGKISEIKTDGSSTSVIFEGDTTKTAYPLVGIQSIAEPGTMTGVIKGKLSSATTTDSTKTESTTKS